MEIIHNELEEQKNAFLEKLRQRKISNLININSLGMMIKKEHHAEGQTESITPNKGVTEGNMLL